MVAVTLERSGVVDREGADGSVGSVVRRPRSLMVSFCGFRFCSLGEISGCVCCDEIGPPLDSSDELSVASGVESESNRGSGDRRFRARVSWSSLSPSILGLDRFFVIKAGVTLTAGSPVWGPAMFRTEE